MTEVKTLHKLQFNTPFIAILRKLEFILTTQYILFKSKNMYEVEEPCLHELSKPEILGSHTKFYDVSHILPVAQNMRKPMVLR